MDNMLCMPYINQFLPCSNLAGIIYLNVNIKESISLPTFYLFVYPSIYLSILPSFCLFTHPSSHLSIIGIIGLNKDVPRNQTANRHNPLKAIIFHLLKYLDRTKAECAFYFVIYFYLNSRSQIMRLTFSNQHKNKTKTKMAEKGFELRCPDRE